MSQSFGTQVVIGKSESGVQCFQDWGNWASSCNSGISRRTTVTTVLGRETGNLNLTCMGWETVELVGQTHIEVDMMTTVQVFVATCWELSVDPQLLRWEGDHQNQVDLRTEIAFRDHSELGILQGLVLERQTRISLTEFSQLVQIDSGTDSIRSLEFRRAVSRILTIRKQTVRTQFPYKEKTKHQEQTS